MRRLISVHLFEKSPEVCGKCGMDTHDSGGCCRNEIKVVKLVQDQNSITPATIEIPSLKKMIAIPSDYLVASFHSVFVKRYFHNHSPPLLSEQDTYLRNSVFRI
jgi:hypothetical protein